MVVFVGPPGHIPYLVGCTPAQWVPLVCCVGTAVWGAVHAAGDEHSVVAVVATPVVVTTGNTGTVVGIVVLRGVVVAMVTASHTPGVDTGAPPAVVVPAPLASPPALVSPPPPRPLYDAQVRPA